ncbi:hypothetical protein HIM_03190 [Hirsutella minnesotensis 3608]|nr:hypothetical protein HIM_03190 [Hirsutella minnesotensis 3608]
MSDDFSMDVVPTNKSKRSNNARGGSSGGEKCARGQLMNRFMKRYKADEALLKTNNTIHPGQVLRMPQFPARAASAIRQFSNPFRQDHANIRDKSSGAYEMDDFNNSYESLESEPKHLTSNAAHKTATRSQDKPFAGPDPPKLPLAIIDDRSSGPVGGLQGSLQDLPFSLISLPEAAVLQYFRRERGEEDHTDLPESFAARARTTRPGTISTLSSTYGPMTPLSAFHDSHLRDSTMGQHKPPPAYQSHFSRRQQTLSFDTVETPLCFSSLVGSSPATASYPLSGYSGRDSGFRATPPMLGSKALKARGFSSNTTQRQAKGMHSFELFTRSEANLIRSAREKALYRRSLANDDDKQPRLLFPGIMIVTVLFPLIGILALCGRFDSTISWYSQGEAHSLTKSQREILKQQLMAEGALYIALITGLSVYYSVHGL